jgi:DNA-binding CsgD family transcriptional regulator
MPWTEPLASSNELRRCIRDLVALSTLPAGWQNYDMRQIGSSIVAALISMLDADFVFIALPGHGNQVIGELARSNLTPESLNHVRTMLQRANATLDSGQEFICTDASGDRDLHVVTAPIGFGSDAILAAGSVRDTFPTKTEKLLLNAGANQAAIAFQQWLGDAEKGRFTALVQRNIADAVRRIKTLSPREREVLDGLVSGRPNKLIAYDLGISVRTVEVHRARMMERLRVRQLADAIRLGVMARLDASPAANKR